jgi:hypothetical protein
MNEELMPREAETLAGWIERVAPALHARITNVTDFESFTTGYANGMWAALWELRDTPPESATDVLASVLRTLMRQRNSRRFTQRLLAESERSAAERPIAECDADDASLGAVEDEHDVEGAARLDAEDADGFLDAPRDEDSGE